MSSSDDLGSGTDGLGSLSLADVIVGMSATLVEPTLLDADLDSELVELGQRIGRHMRPELAAMRDLG